MACFTKCSVTAHSPGIYPHLALYKIECQRSLNFDSPTTSFSDVLSCIQVVPGAATRAKHHPLVKTPHPKGASGRSALRATM